MALKFCAICCICRRISYSRSRRGNVKRKPVFGNNLICNNLRVFQKIHKYLFSNRLQVGKKRSDVVWIISDLIFPTSDIVFSVSYIVFGFWGKGRAIMVLR